MKAGRMRNRITLQKYETSRSPVGSVIKTWVDIATVWAEVNAVSGKELIASSAEQQIGTIRIWMRYRDDISQSCRVVYQLAGMSSNILNIKAVIPDLKKTYLELLCEVGLNNG